MIESTPLFEPDSFAWHEGACAEYESDWIALHRFLWLNGMTGEEFWSLLKRYGSHPARRWREDYPFAERMLKWRATRVASEHIRAAYIAPADENDSYMFVKLFVRFCPQCLSQGFHARVFQYRPLTRCPYHGCELITTCTSCGHPIGSPQLTLDDFLHPLGCSHCGTPFIASDVATVLVRGFPEAASTFRVQQALVDGSCAIPLREFRGHCLPFWDSPASFRFLCQSIAEFSGDTGIDPYWLSGAKLATRVPLKKLELDYVGDEVQEIEALVDDAAAVVKSTGRHLAKLVRKTCGHRNSTVLACLGQSHGWHGLDYFILVEPLDCPCCALLDWWRCEVGKVIALRAAIKRFRSKGIPVSDHYGWYRRSFSLEPNLLRFCLISCFCAMATKMRAMICSDENSEDHFQATVPQYGFPDLRCPYDLKKISVELTILRYSLGPSVVTFKSYEQSAEPVHFAWTLASAEAAMAACLQEHKRSIDQSDARRRRRSRLSRRRRIWYEGVGAYSLGARGVAEGLAFVSARREASAQLDLFVSPHEALTRGLQAVRARLKSRERSIAPSTPT
jgi:hypothetical protein